MSEYETKAKLMRKSIWEWNAEEVCDCLAEAEAEIARLQQQIEAHNQRCKEGCGAEVGIGLGNLDTLPCGSNGYDGKKVICRRCRHHLIPGDS